MIVVVRHGRIEDHASEQLDPVIVWFLGPAPKLIGKKKFADASNLVTKQSSGYALAPESDKREAITPAQNVIQLFAAKSPEQK